MLKHLIDRPITVTMITLVIVVLGIVSIRLLPVSLIPDVDIPYITVQATSSELSAREMDETVLKPLRQQLIQINGLEDIVSEAKDGNGTIRLTFNHGADIDYLFIEVNEKIDRSMSVLGDIARPKVLKASATDIPAFFVNITSTSGASTVGEPGRTIGSATGQDRSLSLSKRTGLGEPDDLFPVTESFSQMSRFARDVISKRIEQLSEVAMVDISGLVSDEILIVPDESKLLQMCMTMSEFEDFVKSSNIRLGSLTIRDGEYRYNVKFDSRASSSEDIANLWFKREGRLLQIKDVATVMVHPAKRTGLVRSDGEDAVCLAVIKQSEAKMSDLKSAMNRLMDSFKEDYPQLRFEITRDQTQLLEYTINNLLQNIVVALLLASVIIFLFMRDFRSPVLVILTMPVALIFSMLCFYAIGLTLNIISLSGLLLGVGMMTDNTVILVDNITGRWQREGNLRSAVLEGTKEVRGAMLSSVLTTCAVFIPLIFLSGIAGAMFYDQAMSVTIVLLTSYIVTILVIPVYYYWWFKGSDGFRPSPLLEKINFDEPIRRWDDKLMEWFIRHRPVAWGLLAVSVIGLAFCFLEMPKSRLPEMTQTDAIMKIDWNEHISVERNAERIKELESKLAGSVEQMTALVGSQQFILSHSGDQGISEASVYVKCKDQRTLKKVQDELRGMMENEYPDAAYSFESSGNIFDMVFAQNEAPLTARLRPVKTSEVEVGQLRNMLAELREALPVVTVADPPVKTDALFVADPDLLALYNINYSELVSILRNSLNENRLFNIVQGTSTVPVVTGSNATGLSEILQDAFIEKKSHEGETVRIPVSDLMRQTFVEDLKTLAAGPEDNYYPLDLNVPSKDVKPVMAAVSEAVREDGSFEVGYSGSYFSNSKMIDEMIIIMLVAIILLYLILASQFESLVQPLIILAEIVVDIFVALLVLWIFGVSINLMSMIGLIVITGIVINDSILKIDTINRMRKAGESLERAVIDASSLRVKAIIMTSLTTILAVCPFLSRGSMGADLQYPMSLVIIAGMLVGTLVSLFVVPALYYSIYNGRKKK